jgi:hypothetical protein
MLYQINVQSIGLIWNILVKKYMCIVQSIGAIHRYENLSQNVFNK